MVKQETITLGSGRVLVKTYSDSNKYIIQNETGVKYAEAIDVPNKYTYTESEEEIGSDEEQGEILSEEKEGGVDDGA